MILIFWVLFAIYWVWYVVVRPKMKLARRWRILYLGNMLFAVFILMLGLYEFRDEHTLPRVNLVWGIMVVGLLIHHLSLWVKYTRWRKYYYYKLHMQIGHTMFFAGMGAYAFFLHMGLTSWLLVAMGILGTYTGIKDNFLFIEH